MFRCLRISVITAHSDVVCDRRSYARPVSDQKIGLLIGLAALQVWRCVVKHGLVTLVVMMILKDTATFEVLFIVSLFCVWNITIYVEINGGVYLLKS